MAWGVAHSLKVCQAASKFGAAASKSCPAAPLLAARAEAAAATASMAAAACAADSEGLEAIVSPVQVWHGEEAVQANQNDVIPCAAVRAASPSKQQIPNKLTATVPCPNCKCPVRMTRSLLVHATGIVREGLKKDCGTHDAYSRLDD